jgi:hypothetical protein
VTAGAGRCRVCAAEVPGGAVRCPSCGAAQGKLDPCPHCRAQAGASLDAELRYVCDACGGPRVPRLDPTVAYSGREVPLLRKADAARKGRAGWRAGAVASGVLLPFVLLVLGALLLIFGASAGLVLMGLVVSAPIGAFLAMALSRAAARGREIAPALDAAWIAVATDVAQQSQGALNAQGLAQRLGIEEPQAEELMALLDVNDAVAGPRLRIAQPVHRPAPMPAPGPTLLASVEEEAAVVEAASAEAEAQRRKGSA